MPDRAPYASDILGTQAVPTAIANAAETLSAIKPTNGCDAVRIEVLFTQAHTVILYTTDSPTKPTDATTMRVARKWTGLAANSGNYGDDLGLSALEGATFYAVSVTNNSGGASGNAWVASDLVRSL
jgi:predicted lipoprotein with Yx(FWY)xxD motif